jgi:hypothetical protein
VLLTLLRPGTPDLYQLPTSAFLCTAIHGMFLPLAVVVRNGLQEKGTPVRREIALGRDPAYKVLAVQTGAAHYRQWAARGITRRTVTNRFGRALHQACARAERIHFALDGITSISLAIQRGRAGFTAGNFTNAELSYIVMHRDLLRKTTFYRDSRVVPAPAFHLASS